MTLLAVSIAAPDIDELRTRAHAAREAGAGLIELRLDHLESLPIQHLASLCASLRPESKVLLTIRSRAEGGAFDGDDADRFSRLIEVGPLADYLDVEWATWQTSANIRQKVGLALKRAGHVSQASGIEEIEHAGPRKLILSQHDTASRPSTLTSDLVNMVAEESCDVPKIAWRARTIRDNFEAFELMRSSPKPPIVICMGDDGLMSRVLAGKFGAFATFASLRPGTETAGGQIDIDTLQSMYRFQSIRSTTRVYGVVGDPVAHSQSPRLHNSGFASDTFDAVYLPMRVLPGYESFKAFMVEVMARPWVDLCGLSITAPHKENAFRFVTENGGTLDAIDRKIGALNTIMLGGPGMVDHPEAKLVGLNTDHRAAREILCNALGDADKLAGMRVSILGAGGVARALLAMLVDAGAEVTVFNRTRSRAAALAVEFNARDADWNDRPGNPDLLINCTPIGQTPDIQASPVQADRLTGFTVFDTVYSPDDTQLLRDAVRGGCPIVRGKSLFLRQAAKQYEVWTRKPAPWLRDSESGRAS